MSLAAQAKVYPATLQQGLWLISNIWLSLEHVEGQQINSLTSTVVKYSVSPIYRGRVYRGIGYIAVARVGVNSIPELELLVNSNSNSGIGIEIGGIENGIGIENPGIGIGIENRNWFFCNGYSSTY